MKNEHIQAKILEVLKHNSLGVVSTIHAENVDDAKPQSAVVGFAQTDALEIIFATPNTTRKYKNIKHNPNISFVVGWNPANDSVQYEGVASEISKADAQKYIELIASKNPFAKSIVEKEDEAFFIVKPSWIRLVAITDTSAETHEISF